MVHLCYSLSNLPTALVALRDGLATGVKAQVSGYGEEPGGASGRAEPSLGQSGERVVTELRKVDHKLRPDEIAALVGEYEGGATVRSLGRRFSVHEQTVRAHLRRAGVILRPVRALTAEQELEAIRPYVDQQLTLDQVGDQLGVGATTVRKVLIRRGVERRAARAR